MEKGRTSPIAATGDRADARLAADPAAIEIVPPSRRAARTGGRSRSRLFLVRPGLGGGEGKNAGATPPPLPRHPLNLGLCPVRALKGTSGSPTSRRHVRPGRTWDRPQDATADGALASGFDLDDRFITDVEGSDRAINEAINGPGGYVGENLGAR